LFLLFSNKILAPGHDLEKAVPGSPLIVVHTDEEERVARAAVMEEFEKLRAGVNKVALFLLCCVCVCFCLFVFCLCLIVVCVFSKGWNGSVCAEFDTGSVGSAVAFSQAVKYSRV
jgi:hypothetical protein